MQQAGVQRIGDIS